MLVLECQANRIISGHTAVMVTALGGHSRVVDVEALLDMCISWNTCCTVEGISGEAIPTGAHKAPISIAAVTVRVAQSQDTLIYICTQFKKQVKGSVYT